MTTERPNVQTREGQEQLQKLGIRPVPVPDDLTRPYWEAARRHELRIQRCTGCQSYNHPPQETCLYCAGSTFEWALLSGRGHVYTFVIDKRLMVPTFDEPYVIAQVNPVESDDNMVRITANIKGCELDKVYIGMPVQVFFEDVTPEITLPQFKPATEAHSLREP